jgi:hypothetical protein
LAAQGFWADGLLNRSGQRSRLARLSLRKCDNVAKAITLL